MASTIVMLGPPGSGKGTQATRLRDGLGYEVLSTGELLRAARAAGSGLGRRASAYMDRGELVPDELVTSVLEDAIAGLGERPVIFDGYPRTVTQARALDRALARRGRRVDSAILIAVPDAEVVRRILGRHQGRSDDTAETARGRLRVYHGQTEPLAAYFAERSLLRRVDGAQDVDRVGDEIRAALTRPADPHRLEPD